MSGSISGWEAIAYEAGHTETLATFKTRREARAFVKAYRPSCWNKCKTPSSLSARSKHEPLKRLVGAADLNSRPPVPKTGATWQTLRRQTFLERITPRARSHKCPSGASLVGTVCAASAALRAVVLAASGPPVHWSFAAFLIVTPLRDPSITNSTPWAVNVLARLRRVESRTSVLPCSIA